MAININITSDVYNVGITEDTFDIAVQQNANVFTSSGDNLSIDIINQDTPYVPPVVDWTPSNISTSIWLDASDLNTIVNDAGLVSEWIDKSGNLNNATQEIASSQPITGLSTIGQLNAIYFNDSILNFNSLGLTQNATAIVVYSLSQDTGYSIFNSSQISQNDGWDLWLDGNTYANNFRSVRLTALNLQVPSTGNIILSYMADELIPSYEVRLNGDSTYSNSNSFIFADNITRLGEGSNGSILSGLLGEVIITNSSDLDTTKLLEGYLAWKWNLVSNLPANHPYKLSKPTI